MVGVLALLCDENISTRDVLHALLICRDATLEQIAEWLTLSPEVVQLYEQLHFNVRDRADEKAYIARIVFPWGRVALLNPDVVANLSYASQLLQGGHRYGAQQVLVLSGLETEAELPSVVESCHELEQTIMANAVQLVRSGYQNSTKATGLNHAMSLMTAMRDGGRQQMVEDDYKTGVGALNIGPGDAIMMTMNGIRAHLNGEIAPRTPPDELRAAVFKQMAEMDQKRNGG